MLGHRHAYGLAGAETDGQTDARGVHIRRYFTAGGISIMLKARRPLLRINSVWSYKPSSMTPYVFRARCTTCCLPASRYCVALSDLWWTYEQLTKRSHSATSWVFAQLFSLHVKIVNTLQKTDSTKRFLLFFLSKDLQSIVDILYAERFTIDMSKTLILDVHVDHARCSTLSSALIHTSQGTHSQLWRPNRLKTY